MTFYGFSPTRYDARNLLDDRESFEKDNHVIELTKQNIEDEKLCEEERWADLDSDAEELYDLSEEERDIYLEEKRKRRQTQEQNKEYKFDYSEENKDTENEISSENASIDDNDNVPYAPKFVVPKGMTKPTNQRVDEIIERTAKFLNASNDPQIEIVLQAKQANNPNFSFLKKDNALYPYYKHVRLLLQTGLFEYGPGSDDDSDDNKEDGDVSDTSETTDHEDTKIIHGSKTEEKPKEDVKIAKEKNCSIQAETRKIGEDNIKGTLHNTNTPQSSGSPTSCAKPYGPVIVPSPKLQTIIDELAIQIAKLDPSQESKIRGQHIDDPQYSFLFPWNEFNPYYKFKIQDSRRIIAEAKREEERQLLVQQQLETDLELESQVKLEQESFELQQQLDLILEQ